MVEKEKVEMVLPRCKKCGDLVPPGKDLCWCCEHEPKLHPQTEKQVTLHSSSQSQEVVK